MKISVIPAVLLLAIYGAGCAGEPATEDRDLSLPPAEAVTPINDTAEDPPADGETEEPSAPPAPPPSPARNTPAPAPPAPPTVAAGTGFLAIALDTLTSRHNNAGDPVVAAVGEDLVDADGNVVVPAGALLEGTITEIAPAENPSGEGVMMITYTSVSFDGQSYAIELATDSMATHMKGRGVTAGQAAKVGAATAVGAIAGRVIGGNRTGTAIGAAAGAAAGVGIAAATRDVDILLDAGAPVFVTIASDFQLVPQN